MASTKRIKAVRFSVNADSGTFVARNGFSFQNTTITLPSDDSNAHPGMLINNSYPHYSVNVAADGTQTQPIALSGNNLAQLYFERINGIVNFSFRALFELYSGAVTIAPNPTVSLKFPAIPVQFRPAQLQDFVVPIWINADFSLGRLRINTDGTMNLAVLTTATNPNYVLGDTIKCTESVDGAYAV